MRSREREASASAASRGLIFMNLHCPLAATILIEKSPKFKTNSTKKK
jgi:hypothetical protein